MSRVVMYDVGINFVLKSSRGPVARIVKKKADLIQQNALSNIQRLTVKRTGDLIASLHQVPMEDNVNGFRVAVGADAHHSHGKSGPFPYARALETGIDPLSGRSMNYINGPFAYMIPAVRQSGFRARGR